MGQNTLEANPPYNVRNEIARRPCDGITCTSEGNAGIIKRHAHPDAEKRPGGKIGDRPLHLRQDHKPADISTVPIDMIRRPPRTSMSLR